MFNTYSQKKAAPADPLKELKKVKLEECRAYHSELLKDLGVSPTDFQIKTAFYDKNARFVVGIFDSEFKKEKGLYFELVDRDHQPIDPERTVYRIAPSTSYMEEYEQTEKLSFLVPLEEIRTVNKQAVAISKSSAVTAMDNVYQTNKQPTVQTAYKAPATMEDAPYSEMTIRDFIAIHTGKPVSSKLWLNDLIKSQLTK